MYEEVFKLPFTHTWFPGTIQLKKNKRPLCSVFLLYRFRAKRRRGVKGFLKTDKLSHLAGVSFKRLARQSQAQPGRVLMPPDYCHSQEMHIIDNVRACESVCAAPVRWWEAVREMRDEKRNHLRS